MCSTDDARRWSNLRDLASVYVPDGSYVTVTISENWFATDIALSTVTGGSRYITYSHDLKENPHVMNVFYC